MLVATILQAIKDSEQRIINAIRAKSETSEDEADSAFALNAKVEEVTKCGAEDPQEFKIFSLDELPTMPTQSVIGKGKFEVMFDQLRMTSTRRLSMPFETPKT